MSIPNSLLPEGYEALEPFVAEWAIAGSANRAKRRDDSNAAERETFFNAVKDIAMPALAVLDKKPLSQLDAKERRLLDLLLTFAHVALAVEVQQEDESKHREYRRNMVITKAPADYNP